MRCFYVVGRIRLKRMAGDNDVTRPLDGKDYDLRIYIYIYKLTLKNVYIS